MPPGGRGRRHACVRVVWGRGRDGTHSRTKTSSSSSLTLTACISRRGPACKPSGIHICTAAARLPAPLAHLQPADGEQGRERSWKSRLLRTATHLPVAKRRPHPHPKPTDANLSPRALPPINHAALSLAPSKPGKERTKHAVLHGLGMAAAPVRGGKELSLHRRSTAQRRSPVEERGRLLELRCRARPRLPSFTRDPAQHHSPHAVG